MLGAHLNTVMKLNDLKRKKLHLNCDIFPNFKEIDYKDSETRKRIGRFLKDGEVYAHFKCNF